MASASIIRLGPQQFQLGAFALKPTGLQVRGKPTRAEWEHCGEVLRRIEGAVQWWVGDWLNYGACRQWGEKYDEASEATGLKYETLADYAYVAQNVRFSVRNENLSFSVHKLVAPLPVAKQREILSRAAAEQLTVTDVRELIRADAYAGKIEAIKKGALPAGEYDVVVADPPWQYDNSGFDQSAAAHYPTLNVEQLCALPSTDPTFPKFADPCVLFLWATSPLLPAGGAVMSAWGFEYKACLVWVKDRAPGLGWWLNTRHELLLVGARGSTTPTEKVDSVIAAAVDEHSRKPVEAYAAIDRMYPPGLRRVECFARQPRDGWDVWGNEV